MKFIYNESPKYIYHLQLYLKSIISSKNLISILPDIKVARAGMEHGTNGSDS